MTVLVTVRASSWGALFDCAARWEAEHLLGMRRPAGLRTSLGTAIHAGTAAYDQATLDRAPIAPDDAAAVFVDALLHPQEEVDYRGDPTITLTEAETIGLALTVRYCVEIAPRFRYRSVEMQLPPLDIDCGGDTVIRLTGTMDRARTALADTYPIAGPNDELLASARGIVIPDIKSGARLIEHGEVILKGRAAQLGAYQLMYEAATGEQTIGGQIIALQTTSKAQAQVSRVFDAKRAMLGTGSQQGLLSHAAQMFQSGLFPPNPLSQLCAKKWCARWDSCCYHD